MVGTGAIMQTTDRNAQRELGLRGGTSHSLGRGHRRQLRTEGWVEGKPGQREVGRGGSGGKVPGSGKTILAHGESESIVMSLKWQEMNLDL